jgi:hypothetical protein
MLIPARRPGPHCAPHNAARRSPLCGLFGCAALVAGVMASTGPSAQAAAALPSRERSAAVLAPGTIFVANAPAGFEGGLGTGSGSVTAYPPSATGNARPIVIITKGILGPTGLTFDSSGDLWVANNSNTNNVVEYSKAELTSASPAPSVTISQSGSGAMGLAFDSSGDLWVTKNNSTVIEFTQAQLAKSGSPVPSVTITNTNQCSVVFDPFGDMWEGSFDAAVNEFTKTQLATSGSPTPHVTVMSDSLNVPCRPTFDEAGDMWAANYLGNTVVEFTKAQLAESGSPTARVTITSDYLANPGDVAFDPAGELWVPSAQDEAVVEFTKAQLANSGTPTPTRAIFGSATGLSWPWALAVEP